MFIGNPEGTGKWKTIGANLIRIEESGFAVTSQLLQSRGYKELVDFDNHLDDVSSDYLNVDLNQTIDENS